MFRFIFLFLIYLCCCTHAWGAVYFDTLKNVSPDNREAVADKIWSDHTITKLSRPDVLTAYNSLLNIARNLDDHTLEAHALEILGKYYYTYGEVAKAIDCYQQGIEIARKFNLDIIGVTITDELGETYYAVGQYPLAFESLLKAADMVKDIGYDKNPGVSGRTLYDVCDAYYKFQEYDKCIVYVKEAIKYTRVHDLVRTLNLYNMLGLCYTRQQKFDSSLKYFNKAIETGYLRSDSASISFIIGNIGQVYYLKKEYTKALSFFLTDYTLGIRYHQWLSAERDLCVIAGIYLDLNNIDSAELQISKVRQLIKAHYYNDLPLQVQLYKALARLYQSKHDYINSYLYIDSLMVFKDSLANKNDAKILNRIEVAQQIQKHQAEVQLLQTQKSRQLILRDAIIVAILLIVALALQEIKRQRVKQKKNHEIFELEKQRTESERQRIELEKQHAELEKEQAEQALKNAETLLESYVESLREKNQLIEQFRTEIQQLEALPNSAIQVKKTEVLEKLIHATILTENDWDKFKELFEEAHKNFFVKLKLKFPDLTQAEIRFLALTKLNLSTKEMANILGISLNSVFQSRYRVCKKINLPEDTNLKDVVANL